jgi:hypothetical protein
VRKRGARIATAEVGLGTGLTDEAVSRAANSPTARVQRAASTSQFRYANDPDYREQKRQYAREYMQDPERKERRRRYLREYNAKVKANPELVKKERERSRQNSRKAREAVNADPERREIYLQKRRDERAGGMLEREVEKYLCDRTEARGGFCPKFIDPGRRGAPDRLVMVPQFPTVYAELKRPKGGWLEPHQKRYHERIRKAGQVVLVMYTKSDVDDYFTSLDRMLTLA